MALTVSDILHDADLFRRAYPNWPHAEPEENAMSTVTEVAEALRAAGHAESITSRNVGMSMETTGFSAVQSGLRVIVVPVIGDDVEGHFDSPAHAAMMQRMVAGYRKSLRAAGWDVAVPEIATALIVSLAA